MLLDRLQISTPCARPTRAPASALAALLAALLVLSPGCADDSGLGVEADVGAGDAAQDAGRDAVDVPDLGDDTGGASSIALQSSGLSVRVDFDPFAFEVKDPSGRVVLRSEAMLVPVTGELPPGAYGPPALAEPDADWEEDEWVGWESLEPETPSWTSFDRTISRESTPGSVHVVLGASAGAATLDVTLIAEDNRLIVEMVAGGASDEAWLGQTFALGEDERFFGLGGRLDGAQRGGASYRGWVEANGRGRGEAAPPGPDNPRPNGADMTGFPIPFLLSSEGYGLWLESGARWALHLGSEEPTHWRVEVAEAALRYTVFVNADPLKTLAEYTERVGRPALPPEWVFGPRRYVAPDATVYDMPEYLALREFGVATTTLEDEGNPLLGALPLEPSAQVDAELRSLGYRRIGRLAPLISSLDETLGAAYDRAVEQGFVLTDEAGDPYLVAAQPGGEPAYALLDPTVSRAARWFASRVEGLHGQPRDGWRVEGLELVPRDARFADGSLGRDRHNDYAVAVQQVLFDSLAVGGEGEGQGEGQTAAAPVLLSDAGYTGSAALQAMAWSGPLNTSFEAADGLPAAVRVGINLGLSGFPFYGTDVGGNDGDAGTPLDRELLLRWSAFATFAPGMASGGALTSSDWSIWSDEDTLQVFAAHAQLHTRLAPYLHALAAQAVERGAPMMRHPFLHFPTDPEAMAVDDAYFLGRRLYVAPVLERGASSRPVYLPAGTYVDWHSGEVLRGGQTVVVDAPLGTIPVFLADGAIVPLYDERVDTLVASDREDVVDAADASDVLDVRAVLSGGTASFTLVDGTVLELSLNGELAAPYATGSGQALPLVSDAAELEGCGGCYLLSGTNPRVLRVTTTLAEVSRVEAGGLVASATHPAGSPRRVRWEITVPATE